MIKYFLTISYYDYKGGVEWLRVFRKSYARYRKHGFEWMIQRLLKEYESINSSIVYGKLEYDSKRETLVFVSHESSATGAPLLGHNIAGKLSERYNIIHIMMKRSNIHDAFLTNCDLMLSGIQSTPYISSKLFLNKISKQRAIKCVICNSVVTYPVLQAAHDLNMPSLSLIHEFSEYTRPTGTMFKIVKDADAIVVPAAIIKDSLLKEVMQYVDYKRVPNHIHIIPQGKLPDIPDTYGDENTPEELYSKLKINSGEDVKIIVASGWVQIRKGTDSFVALARYIKQLYSGKCKFVWVGDGFDPERDLGYSVWLQREIEFSGLGDDFIFLQHQKNLDTIFAIADVFCMTSRMDPFPNVVIDALNHDLHIACFDHASGSVEFLLKHGADCTVADYLDTYRLSEKLVSYLESSQRKKTGINKSIVEKHLNFDQYIDAIDRMAEAAVEFREKSHKITEFIIASGEFDSRFCGGEENDQASCRNYVDNALKGIHTHNPKPGFSEHLWLTQNSVDNPYIVPLYEALKVGRSATHHVKIVPDREPGNVNFTYAVHLHLFYLDLADWFAGYFQHLPGTFDLFITVIKKDAEDQIVRAFSGCGARNVKVVYVENIGRDSGPLFFGLKDRVLNGHYAVIGHFHSKKSLDIEGGMGDRWRTFLMENLIGDKAVARSVLSIFNDPKVGLVFPDDPHVVDIGDNREYIKKLCDMLNLPAVEETPIFPVGNMFWARIDAINTLFGLNPEAVLEKEPLPYDGSYMHAIERITPAIVHSQNYEIRTVYLQGSKW